MDGGDGRDEKVSSEGRGKKKQIGEEQQWEEEEEDKQMGTEGGILLDIA